MRLITVEYPERRLNFFKEQLAAAHRRLDWSMKHNPDWNDHDEKGEMVSYYEWAVQMAEGNHEAVVRCSACKHGNHDGNGDAWCDVHCGYISDTNAFCSYGERKDGEG